MNFHGLKTKLMTPTKRIAAVLLLPTQIVSSATFTKPLGKDGEKESKKTKGKLGTITVSECVNK